MTMTIAIDDQARVVSIDEVARGLVCGCRCIECAEPVVARKGTQRIHHFSHVSQKMPCEVMPESFLHRYAKQVVQESLGLQLPPQPGHHPNSDDQSSWWDFDSVEQEVWLGEFRPDLVADLPDGPLLLEFACTSFVDDDKQARIEQLGVRAVEVDLSGLLVTPTAEGLQELRRAILHDVSLKQWLYLSLPADTSKEVALQVFINMNTNSKPLSLYDIIVAEVENVAGRSLHELQVALHEKCPHVSRYSDLSDLILSTSALLQDKISNTRGMVEMSKQLMLDNWPTLERGLERMAALLASQGVYDAARLPTNAVLAVIAASYALIPEHGDFLGNAEKLLRRYLWSSFFTDRYENSAASRAFADFKAMKILLQKKDFKDEDLTSVPVLDRAQHPLATLDELMSAGWPKGTGIEARAIMAVTTYLGAVDFADHKAASYESLQKREYHHVFPDALLAEAKIPSYLALNCALITWKTNRSIGRKDPLDYLKDRVDWAGEDTVRKRLKTHLIDYDVLANAHYGVATDEAFEKRLNADFTAFLHNRARLVEAAMQQLAVGESADVTSLWTVLESVEEAVV